MALCETRTPNTAGRQNTGLFLLSDVISKAKNKKATLFQQDEPAMKMEMI